MKCEYGCDKEGKYQLKNGKWCCNESSKSCKEIIRKSSEGRKGTKRTEKQKHNISISHIGQKSDKKGLTYEEYYGIEKSKKIKNKMKIRKKNTIEKIKKQYLFFSQIEEMRYNPDKPGEKEIQVHCKNHNCPNSKEQGGWFTPTYIQLYERIRQIEKNGQDFCYLYCSDECKNKCPLYGFITNINNTYTYEEYETWKNFIKERDNNECQICESNEDIHIHHIIPQKLQPYFSLDPENGICLCKKCHYKYGHKDKCDTNYLSKIKCINI